MTWRRAIAWVTAAILAGGILGSVGVLAVPPAPAPQPPHCVALLAKAFTTPKHEVSGSWDCFNVSMQFDALTNGISGDAGIEAVAAANGVTEARLIGSVGAAWMYDFRGPGVEQVVFIFADSTDQVYRVDGETL